MNREKTHLYKKQHQQPIEEETPLQLSLIHISKENNTAGRLK